jgi:hypothetical protein
MSGRIDLLADGTAMNWTGELAFNQTPSIARWTTRVALFSVLLAGVALAAHRFGPMPTLTAFNLTGVAFACAILALVLGLISWAIIWRQGCAGALRVTFGMALALALLCWPIAFWPAYRELPPITDISTDTASPPKFVKLASIRGPGLNGATYPVRFAKLQAEAYPDLKPMIIDRPVEEAFEIVREAVFRQKMDIVREEPPDTKAGKSGVIEAVDRTTILGLYEDVAVRVDGDGARARIDLRSASRFGTHDFGRNAERMRRLMREIVARLEATIPSATGESYVKWRKRGPLQLKKKGLTGDAALRAARRPGDASRGDAQREPEQKAEPRSKEPARVPNKPQRRSQE